MHKLVLVCMLCMLLLTGCGEKEESVTEEYISERTDYCYLNDLMFQLPGIEAGCLEYDDYVEIYPYFNLPNHITIEQLVRSSEPFFETIISLEEVSDTVQQYENITVFQYGGCAYGYIYLNDDYVLVAYTDDLPADYIKVVMQGLCQ